jgi:flagellar motor switch protein FliN
MADSDDLLNPDEIEALLQSSGAAPPASAKSAPPSSPSASAGIPASGITNDLLDPSEIENLLKQRDTGAAPAPMGRAPTQGRSETERLLDQAEADLAKAIGGGSDSRRGIPNELGAPGAYQFASFDSAARGDVGMVGLPALQDVELDLRIELGRTELLVDEVLKLKEGSVVPLDKLAGDPVDILVNGRLIARGEVLVLNDNFCVRVAEILTPDF